MRQMIKSVIGLLGCLILMQQAFGQYTRGNLVVLQSQGNTSAAAAIKLIEYATTGGSAIHTFSLPNTGTNRIAISGSATTEGQISLSAERDRLIVVGYDTASGLAAVSGTTSANVKRVIASIDPSRNYVRQYTTTANFSGGSIRGGSAFGSNFIACGASGGTILMNTPAAISTTASNQRAVMTYNGNIYSSTSTGIFVLPGMSTSTGQTATNLIGTAIDCNAFALSPNGLTLYIASGTAATGIAKYTRSSGGLTAFTFQYAICSTAACTGIAVDFSTTNATIYAIKGSGTFDIMKFQDMGSAASSQATLTTLVTGSSATPFRGIAFAPAVYTATIAGTATIASGDSALITLTGNPFATITYNINGGSSLTKVLDSSGTGIISTGVLSTSGTYTYNLFNEIVPSGTTSMSGSAVITVGAAAPTITTHPSNASVCVGSTATYVGAASGGSITYSWQRSTTGTGGAYTTITGASMDAGLTYAGFNTATLTVTPSASSTGYAYRFTANNGSGTATSTGATFTSIAIPTVAAIAGATSVCAGNTVTLTDATAGGSWSLSDTTIATMSAGGIVSAITAGNVVVTYTISSSGCTNRDTALVTVLALPNIGLTGTTTISSGGSAVLTFSGTASDVVYYWNGASTLTTTLSGAGTSTVTVSPSVTTTYSVTTATGLNGCSQSFTGITAIITIGGSASDTIPTRDNNMAMGNPSGATTSVSNTNNYLMTKSQFTLSYNDSRGLANWVSWHLSRAWKGAAARCDCFTQDGTLPSGYYRASTGNYTGTGFDRGHLCPSDDRDGSDTDNAATFIMTNITPQAPFLNQQPWSKLEEYCRQLVYLGNELYIISGNYGTGGTGSAGGTTSTIASGNITVPSRFWKAVVVLPVGVNDVSRVTANTRVFAINMPNVQTASTDAWEEYKISIDSLETLTGYNFLSAVSSTIQSSIESKPEVTLVAWDFRGINSPTSQVATMINPKMDTSTASSLNTLTRGSGASASTATNSFRTTGFGTGAISTSNTDYFQFKVKGSSGYTTSLTGIDMAFGGTATFYDVPGVTSQFAYSLNGTTYTLIGSPIQSTSVGPLNVDLSSVTALQNLPSSTTVYFRYYASGQTTGGAWGFNSNDTGVYGLSVYGKLSQGCSGTPTAGVAVATDSAICSGNTSSLSAIGISTGAGYTYQWQSSTTGAVGTYSNISGATNTTYVTPALTAISYYRLQTTCSTSGLSNQSVSDTIGVISPATPSVTIASSVSGSICAGTSVTYTATPANGGSTPLYQWKKNGVNISGATSSTYTYSPVDADTIRCQLTSSATCVTSSTALSNGVVMTIIATVTPTITIAASPSGSVCAGTSVTYTATITNGGAGPVYQWFVSGSSISGATNSTYSYAPTNGDSVYCQLTSNATCAAPATLLSAKIGMTVLPTVPTVGAISGGLSVSVGGSSTLTSSTSGGTWASANTSIVTISTGGVITGVALGNTTITYTITTTCGSNYDTAIATVAAASGAPIADTVWSGMTAASAAGVSTFASLPATTTPGSSVVNVSQWNRIGLSNATGTGFYNSSNWSLSTSYSSAVTENKYAFFTITNNASTEVKVTKIVIISQRSASGPTTLIAKHRLLGSSANQDFGSEATLGTSSAAITFSGNVCIAPGQTDTFKIYGWGATSTGGTARVANGSYIKATYVMGVGTLALSTSTVGATPCIGGNLILNGGTPSNGLSPYSFLWNGPMSFTSSDQVDTSIAAAASAGTYTLTALDAMGCLATNTVTASINSLPTITCIADTTAYCYGGSTNMVASGAASYSWLPATALSATTGNSVVCSALSTRTYTITGVDSNGCIQDTSVTITVHPLPTPTVAPGDTSICLGDNINLIASGASSYSWSPATWLSSATGASVVCSATANITYTLTATSSLGCSQVATQLVHVLPVPDAGIIVGDSTVCVGTTLHLVDTVSGGSWSSGSTGIASVSGGMVYGITSGTATISYSLSGVCGNDVATKVIHVQPVQWFGSASSDWTDTANWTCGVVPTVTNDIEIPAGTAYAPVIASSLQGYTQSINLASGSILTINGTGALHIKGDVTNNGAVTGNGTVRINNSAAQTVTGIGSVNNLEINNVNGVTITGGGRLTVNKLLTVTLGTLTTNDSLVLNSDSSNTARVAPVGGNIVGQTKVVQYIPGGRRAYRFMAHPFNNYIALSQLQQYIDITGPGGSTNGFTTTGSNAASAFRYDPTVANSALGSDPGWRRFASTSASVDSNKFNTYQGIRIFLRGAKGEGLSYTSYTPSATTISMVGQLNIGTQTVHLTKGGSAGQDYNMVGNPYASPVNIGQVLHEAKVSGNIVGAAYYIWNPYLATVGQFQAIPVNTTSATPYYIQANASFQVRAANNNDSLIFNESHKSGNVTSNILKLSSEYVTLNIYDANYHMWDGLMFQFSDEATTAEDNDFDAVKAQGPDFNFYSISSDDKKLAIDGRPFEQDRVIPLGVSSNYEQTFIIKAQQVHRTQGGTLYLRDKMLNQYVALQEGSEYRFQITKDKASQGNSRFELSMKPSTDAITAMGLTVNMQPNPASEEVTINYTSSASADVQISIMDISGMRVYNQGLGKQASGTVRVPISQLASGVYMVELVSGNNKVQKPIVVQ